MMPKALFFNIPGHGHINPSLPLVSELVERGYTVHYYATEGFRTAVEATGAQMHVYQQIDDDYFSARGLDGTKPARTSATLLATTEEIMPRLLEQTAHLEAKLILYDCMCPWGYYIAYATNQPAISSHSLMPMSMRAARDWQILRTFLPALIKGIPDYRRAGRIARALGERYNVTPLDLTTYLGAPGDITISYSSPAFVPYADALPDHFRFVGWRTPESEPGETFHHEGKPLIYLSLGTVINENRAFFQTCIEALAGSNFDVLISTGGGIDPESFGDLPENIEMQSWVPQVQVLAHTSLFVTHGGLNSIHDGLYFGNPLLVVPQHAEQTVNGLQVVRSGAGEMLKNGQVTIDSFRSAIHRLLSDDSYQTAAEHIGSSFRAGSGIAGAVDEIERLL